MNRNSTRFRHVGAHAIAGALTLMFAVTGGACGGGGGSSGSAGASGGAGKGGAGTSGGGGAADNTAPGQCKQFVSTFCNRLNQCEPPDGGVAAATTACNTDYGVAVGCDRATSTMFADCISDVKGLSCAGLGFIPDAGFQQPVSCNTPLNIQPSAAQTKCDELAELLCDPVDACGNTPLPTSDQNFVACEEEAYFDLGCAFAVSESSTFDDCLTALCAQAASDAGTDDGGGPPLPTSCNGIIVGPM